MGTSFKKWGAKRDSKFFKESQESAEIRDALVRGDEQEVFKIALPMAVVYAKSILKRDTPAVSHEDIAQEALMAVLKKLDSIDPDYFSSYLYRTILNKAISLKRRVEPNPVVDDPASSQEGPQEFAINQERLATITAVIDQLKPEFRRPLRMFYFDNKGVVQIADELGTPVGTIKRRLMIGRQKIKAKLENI